MGRYFWVVWLSAGIAVAQTQSPVPNAPKTQEVMRQLFVPVSVLLPLSFDAKGFGDPEQKKMISDNINLLQQSVGALQAHAASQSVDFRFVAASLERDIKNLGHLYANGQYEQARFVLHNLTENCVSCHSSLPEQQRFSGAGGLLAAFKHQELPDDEEVRYLVMVRQFDEAMTIYERILSRTDTQPVGFGDFVSYLKLAIRVKRDLKRPLATLEQYVARPKVQPHAKAQVGRWLKDLKTLDRDNVLAKPPLPTARRLITEGRKTMEFSRDPDALIPYLVANAMLSKWVHEQPKISRQQKAEAHYLLGITDSLLDDSLWISRLEFDLETAIRTAPEGPFATKALNMLEENYRFGYSGSSGTNIPEDIQAKLADLKKLIAGKQPKAR